MTRRQGTTQFVAGLAALALAGCGTIDLFGEYEIPESPDVAAAPWPRLVDVPEAPPVGVYTENVPDPERGVRTVSDLSADAAVAEVLSAGLGGTDRAAGLTRRSEAAILAAANARAAALSGPVITEAEREEMLERARDARK